MSYINAANELDEKLLPVAPATPKQFVVYPREGKIHEPSDEPTGTHYRRSFWGSQSYGSPLWVEVHELLPTEVEVQRDGGIALHFHENEACADITVIPRDLTAFVRVFATLDEATRHALAQNTQLNAVHERWERYAKQFKLELEARYGRAAAPKPLLYRVSLGQGSGRESHVMDAASLIGRVQLLLASMSDALRALPVNTLDGSKTVDEAACMAVDFANAERLP
jgi:hypothetical protein